MFRTGQQCVIIILMWNKNLKVFSTFVTCRNEEVIAGRMYDNDNINMYIFYSFLWCISCVNMCGWWVI